ncbi:hypothetical protein NDU88_002883 [Pleurodeles waltl]|uniref:Uncharacterized protein n=1 Tax=Pleurodeles waltl TaxID=8319 RepID=A0AAV7T3P2_PLEWA|nr:hypothetical protein NDU88_002883 [Pleurodeles waltl]
MRTKAHIEGAARQLELELPREQSDREAGSAETAPRLKETQGGRGGGMRWKQLTGEKRGTKLWVSEIKAAIEQKSIGARN